MTLYMIGIGLWDEKDITVKGLEAVKACDKVYLESYTSKLGVDTKKLEDFYGKKIILANRDLIENKAVEILEPAKTAKVALLVIGDVFGATTHTDFYLRAKERDVEVIIINNASIMNAIGNIGLELYKYGKTTSIPYHNEKIEAPYDVIKANKANKLHTLCLLDIDTENNRYMTVKEAIEYLLRVEDKRKENIFTKETMCVGVARLGSPKPTIVYDMAENLLKIDFGEPMHSLIIPGQLHFMEVDALKHLIGK